MDGVKELHNLIDSLVLQNGSDLHLSEGRHPIMRITKELVTMVKQSELSREVMLDMLEEMVGSKEALEKFFIDKEVDFSYSYKDTVRLRGNAFIHKSAIGIALRLIPEVKDMQELNLPPIIAEFARKKQGFFLVVGPVGQGKSTTMASMINLINEERSEHIVTIEDPIEYIFEPKRSIIDQREVGIDTDNFETALKSIFRQDVNVIMIGEMRSPETIGTAVTAAETGHLVISTLHTNNASQTIDRIIDAFPAEQQDQIRVQLASSLLGIFSQRLVPRVAGGLIPAYEFLINNNAVANLIREKRTHEIDVVIETGHEQGMIDMNRCLIDLVRKGEITMENAFAHSVNPKALERLI